MEIFNTLLLSGKFVRAGAESRGGIGMRTEIDRRMDHLAVPRKEDLQIIGYIGHGISPFEEIAVPLFP
jgi:hypothetical protein